MKTRMVEICWCSGYHTEPVIPETWVRFPAGPDQFFVLHYFEFMLLSTNSNILLTTACIVQSCDAVKQTLRVAFTSDLLKKKQLFD